MHVCGSQRPTRIYQEPSVLLLNQTFSLRPGESSIKLGWITSEPQGSSCLPLPALRLQTPPGCPAFSIVLVLVFVCLFVFHFSVAFFST